MLPYILLLEVLHVSLLYPPFALSRRVRPSVRLHYRVRSINPIPIEGFSSNLAEMFTSTSGCAELMWPFVSSRSRSQLKVKYQTIKY